MSTTVSYKGNVIHTAEGSTSFTLNTQGNYLNGDVEVVVSESGGGQSSVLVPKSITQNGTYNPANDNADGYSEVTVNVSGGSSGIYVGTSEPSNNFGNNGDYYYRRRQKATDGIVNKYSLSPGSSGTKNTGYKFRPVENITVQALLGYVRSSIDVTMYLYDSSYTVLAQVNGTNLQIGWNRLQLSQPVELIAGHDYIVTVSSSNAAFSYVSASAATMNSKIVFLHGAYSMSAGNDPTSSDSSNIYLADIQIIDQAGIYSVVQEYYKTNGSWQEI